MGILTEAPQEAEFREALQKIIESEVAKVERLPLEETDLTMDRVIARYHLSDRQARKLLKTLTGKGLVKRIRVYSDSEPARIAWRPVEKKE